MGPCGGAGGHHRSRRGGWDSTADLLDGVDWANDNGATEVSMSWSSPESSGETNIDSLFDANQHEHRGADSLHRLRR